MSDTDGLLVEFTEPEPEPEPDEEAIARLQARTEGSREDVIKALAATGGAPAVLRPGRGHGAHARETV